MGSLPAEPHEIERKYLLRELPPLPPHAVALRIEQGYLSPDSVASSGDEAEDDLCTGRLRRVTNPDGSLTHLHTLKTGHGLVRTEIERTITAQQFARAWPRTTDRRLTKTRHRVPDGALVWEIDRFDGLDLVIAEVELLTPEAKVAPPAWLAPHVVREVTDEPAFTNYAISKRLADKSSTSSAR
jgi:adenylate cyclase